MINKEKQKLKEKYTQLAKKYLDTKKILVIFIALILILMFSKAFKGILLIILFIPLVHYSVRITRFVPHITLETYTGSAILMAYLYGPAAGALSALVLGIYGYFSNGVTKFLALLNVFVATLTGFVFGFLVQHKLLNLGFSSTFFVAILFNNIVSYFVFLVFDPDQIQNVIYRITHVIWNGFISILFFTLLYNLYNLF
ncbi:MAG: hypothetical protein QXE31_05305 [Candidatus Woesearchaeota archaeon]